ncbi:unnamed protein product [Caenorhabditis brenneri]
MENSTIPLDEAASLIDISDSSIYNTTTILGSSHSMTPVVIVRGGQPEPEKVDPMYVIGAVTAFFALIYLAIVLYRRCKNRFTWYDSFAFSPNNVRVEYANRAHQMDDVESAPKQATVVRFVVDGKILGNDD